MKAEIWYMWFKLYQRDIKDDGAKFDFLYKVRLEMPLEKRHEDFFIEYAAKRKIQISTNKNEEMQQ
jgi:hypothetical protein